MNFARPGHRGWHCSDASIPYDSKFRACPAKHMVKLFGDAKHSRLAWIGRTDHPAPEAGESSTYARFPANPAGLTAANSPYTATITVTDTSNPAAINSPQVANVIFTISPADALRRWPSRRKSGRPLQRCTAPWLGAALSFMARPPHRSDRSHSGQYNRGDNDAATLA